MYAHLHVHIVYPFNFEFSELSLIFAGFIAFVILMIYFLVASIIDQEKWEKIVVYMAFFTGAVLCMFFSWVFHTVYCHSSKTSLLFSK